MTKIDITFGVFIVSALMFAAFLYGRATIEEKHCKEIGGQYSYDLGICFNKDAIKGAK